MRLCLLGVLASLVVGASLAMGSGRDVIADWYVDGELNGGPYKISELRAALNDPYVKEGQGVYDAFIDLVNAQITAQIAGGKDNEPGGKSATPDKTPTQTAPDDGGQTGNEQPPQVPIPPRPQPPASTATDDLPGTFIVLSALAGLLLLVGGGTAAARWLRRR